MNIGQVEFFVEQIQEQTRAMTALHEQLLEIEARMKLRDVALRDHFAGLAMQSLFSQFPQPRTYRRNAEDAYMMADAMLEARKA